MLFLEKSKHLAAFRSALTVIAILLMAAGVYILVLLSAPAVVPYVSKPIEPSTLAKPVVSDNRIVIPKIGVNIPFDDNESSLESGAWWRHSDRGDPEKGGNFILSAHRFTLWSTVQKTIEKSPFYNVDKLNIDDQIIVDFNGQRYLYSIDRIFDVKPSQVEIEEPSNEPKLTLYTCTLGGSADGRVVLTATPKGEVDQS